MLQAMRNPVVQRTLWITIVITFVAVFIFAETSGLLGRSPVTRGTEVGKVNGEPITYDNWLRFEQGRLKQVQEQRGGEQLTLDESKRVEDQSWSELVGDLLLQQEIRRRNIGVSDQEIVEAAQFLPPPEFRQNPEFQTEGRFDLQKYQRFLKSPIAKQQGILAYLENYYRTELPKQKLYEQIAATVYVPDSQLWWLWQIGHDSAQVSFAAFPVESVPDSAVKVSDEEIRAAFDKRKDKLESRPGRAVLSIARIARTPTAADTAATRAHIIALREEIAKGAKFEDVAKRESSDSVSAAQGGSLGKSTKGQFVAPFENAAYALKVGELSQPVLSPFGYHILRVDERKGDTLTIRHILLKVQQSDSVATRTDKLADDLAKATANADLPAKFDAAVKQLKIPVVHGVAIEGEPMQVEGHSVPSVSAWAFGGTSKVGESSDIYDAPDGYYIA
ncbi:MAG: SurA N-terminal domain-containing protein, partial [Gemmatimonadota bacterium]|nr:SurA N-terminal domain-containing protein [Gemmatimonadota bacterium]